MPQLLPGPWFATLIFLWLVFLTLLPMKILTRKFLNEPIMKDLQSMKAGTWNWPW